MKIEINNDQLSIVIEVDENENTKKVSPLKIVNQGERPSKRGRKPRTINLNEQQQYEV